jgi:hypothetical protein
VTVDTESDTEALGTLACATPVELARATDATSATPAPAARKLLLLLDISCPSFLRVAFRAAISVVVRRSHNGPETQLVGLLIAVRLFRYQKR